MDRAHSIADTAAFDAFATPVDVPGLGRVSELKLLITEVGSAEPTLWFFDTRKFEFHFYFARDGLEMELSNAAFTAITYFRADRTHLAGSLVHYPHAGVFAAEFWPGDPVTARLVDVAFTRDGALAIKQARPWVD